MLPPACAITGITPDGTYVEIVETPRRSIRTSWAASSIPSSSRKPLEPHPLFTAFIKAAYENRQRRIAEKSAAEVEMFLRPEKVVRS